MCAPTRSRASVPELTSRHWSSRSISRTHRITPDDSVHHSPGSLHDPDVDRDLVRRVHHYPAAAGQLPDDVCGEPAKGRADGRQRAAGRVETAVRARSELYRAVLEVDFRDRVPPRFRAVVRIQPGGLVAAGRPVAADD